MNEDSWKCKFSIYDILFRDSSMTYMTTAHTKKIGDIIGIFIVVEIWIKRIIQYHIDYMIRYMEICSLLTIEM